MSSWNNPILLIDSSYLTYSRFYATITWFKKSQNREITDSLFETEEFLNRFKENYFINIIQFQEKYHVPNENVFIIRDCPRETIWRKQISEDYKATRDNECKFEDMKFNIGKLFKYTYHEIYPDVEKIYKICKFDKLEADDIIGTFHKLIRKRDYRKMIIILTNDHDFLQLIDHHTYIWNTQNKLINNKTEYNAEQVLLKKIILGDLSDNIPGIIDNNEMVNEWLNDPNGFYKLLENNIELREKYNRNKKLIDLREIPVDLKIIMENYFKTNIILKYNNYEEDMRFLNYLKSFSVEF